MGNWEMGGLLTLALAAGFGLGWWLGTRLHLRMPSVVASTAVLVAGSLGGPLLTSRLLGSGVLSFSLALLIAGFAAGLTFWPMGQRQGEREWL